MKEFKVINKQQDYGELVDKLAERLFQDDELKQKWLRKQAVVKQPEPWHKRLKKVVSKDLVKKTAIGLAQDLIGGIEVSCDDVLRFAAKLSNPDRSVEMLEVLMLKKVGVDEKAKEYWERYVGDYGKALTREFKDLIKYKKMTVKDAVKLAKAFDSWFGGQSDAGIVLRSAAVWKIQQTIGEEV